MSESSIPALTPRSSHGHQFVCYADCCSGIPGTLHESNFAAVNAVVSRLWPKPEFICFPGDEIKGLLADPAELRQQWRHWFEHEMAWLDREAIPLYHTTGNHTTYDPLSERIFREVLAHLPKNGPAGQEGLSYFIRRGDLLMIFVNTSWSGLGDGRVEIPWLEQTLAAHADAHYKLVFGHHPAFPVNGFLGAYQRNLDDENRCAFWRILVQHGVLAYLCSHMLAFDVQVHDGVLQVMTAGAGTAPQMPEESEYLHCVQFAVDDLGLRYQVLDTKGTVREWLAWPLILPSSETWTPLTHGDQSAPGFENTDEGARVLAFRFDGICPPAGSGDAQTLLCASTPGPLLAPLWIGLQGPERRLLVLLSAAPGRSPHYWMGPALQAGRPFSIQIALQTGMGPGGLLWRWSDAAPWSSLLTSTSWGAERLRWPTHWSVGYDQHGPSSRPFLGTDLKVCWTVQELQR